MAEAVFGVGSGASFQSSGSSSSSSASRRSGIQELPWPSPDQSTATLALQLDTRPVQQRVTQSLRASVCESFSWADSASGPGSCCRASRLANAAVLGHVPTAAVRLLSAVAAENVGLWAAIRSGRLGGRVAFAASREALQAYGRRVERMVTATDRTAWKKFVQSRRDVTSDNAERKGGGSGGDQDSQQDAAAEAARALAEKLEKDVDDGDNDEREEDLEDAELQAELEAELELLARGDMGCKHFFVVVSVFRLKLPNSNSSGGTTETSY